MARKLKQIIIEEVSLVDEPANRRYFAVVKRFIQKGTKMDELRKLIESFTGKKLDDELVEKSKKNDVLVSCLTDHLKMIDKYRGDLPVDLVASVGYLATQAAFMPEVAKANETKTEEKVEEKKEEKVEEIDVDKFVAEIVAKATESVSKDMQSKIDAISERIKQIEAMLTVNKSEQKAEEQSLSEADIVAVIDEVVASYVGK